MRTATPAPQNSFSAISFELPSSTRRPRVTLPSGGALDALDLSTIVPGATPLPRSDGSLSGINVLPLDELPFEEFELVAEPVAIDLPKYRIASEDPAVRAALAATPLFAELPPRVLEQLIARMAIVVLDPGEIVFREGEPGGCLYVISEGEVSVESAGGALARLGPSSFFGEVALITDQPRSATIRAITRVELLAIDRDVVRDATAEQPEIVNVLLRFVRDRLVDRMTQTSELFRPFADHERRELSNRFELVEVASGVQLIVQGARADGLYVLVAGQVEVWHDGDPNPVSVLGSGDVFGETSLLGGGGSSANCRAASRVLALRMPARTFQEVIMTHPQVLAYLAELEDRRSPHARSAEFMDLHLDMF